MIPMEDSVDSFRHVPKGRTQVPHYMEVPTIFRSPASGSDAQVQIARAFEKSGISVSVERRPPRKRAHNPCGRETFSVKLGKVGNHKLKTIANVGYVTSSCVLMYPKCLK